MRLLVSAFEFSANRHLRTLLRHIDAELYGIFDKELGDPIIDLQTFAVMGFVDAFKKLPLFLSLKRQMVDLAAKVDQVLLIDASGFNLPLAKAIKHRYPDKRIVYYILPQAWAWRRGRIKQIVANVDTACSILPFERDYYPHDYDIRYVGHPLLDTIPAFKEKPTKHGPILFMPGSRKSEIQALMPIFREVRAALDHEALLVIPSHFDEATIERLYGDTSDFTILRDPYAALLQAEFAFICSGTATLEAALIGTPFALTYIAKPIDYFIAKRFAHIEHVGLANIMLKDFHPEFLQEAVTPKNLLYAYQSADPTAFLQKSMQLRNYLGHGSAKEVAKVLYE